MLTFQDQYQMYQQITGDYSAAGLIVAKRDINEGGAMFLNRLGRKYNREYKVGNLISGKQYYQFSGDVLRLSEAQCKNGNNWYTPILVTSEDQWNALNSQVVSGSIPTHQFIRGHQELGLYPVPSTSVTNGLTISYEPQHNELTKDDYTTGTLQVTNGAQTIIGTGTTFTADMVGRYIHVTDGTDGRWYRISSFTDATHINIENYYEGTSGSTKAYRIGEAMKMPMAYQDAPVYYAVDRFYLTQNDQKSAEVFRQRFDLKVRSAKETFAHSTSRMGSTRNVLSGRQPSWLDLTKPVTYP